MTEQTSFALLGASGIASGFLACSGSAAAS